MSLLDPSFDPEQLLQSEPIVAASIPSPSPEPIVAASTPSPSPEPIVAASTPSPSPEPIVVTPVPMTEYQNPLITAEELPLVLAHAAVATGVNYSQVGPSAYMISGEHAAWLASQGVGDSNLAVNLESRLVGSPYGESTSGSGAIAIQRPTFQAPVKITSSGPDFPNELIRNINSTSLVKYALMILCVVVGSSTLLLLFRGLQTPSERAIAAQGELQREYANAQTKMVGDSMKFVRDTGKQNAKLAQGRNDFCIGNCARPASVEVTSEEADVPAAKAVTNPAAARLVAKWRAKTSDPEKLRLWASQVEPNSGKFGNLTEKDVMLALTSD